MNFTVFAAELSEVEKINEVVDDVSQNPGLLKQYMDAMPQKALDLGIRTALTLAIIVIGVLITSLIRKTVKTAMVKMNADLGTISFTDSVIKFLGYLFLILFVLVRYGVDATSIVAVIGSLGLTAGLALQGALQNFAGGIIILCIKPFKVGDYISQNKDGIEGTVADIGLFYTEITTIDNKSVYLPNGSLANGPIVNLTSKEYRGLDAVVGISYKADINKAKEVALKVLNSEMGIEVRDTYVYVEDLSDYAVKLRLRASVPTADYLEYKRHVLEKIKYAFDSNGVDIPFPQVDIHMLR